MKTIKYFLSVLLIVAMSACDLQRDDFTEISPDNFPKTEKDLQLAANALYYYFTAGEWGDKCIYSAGYGGYQVISDMSTDALWSCWGWQSDDLYYQQWYASMSGSVADLLYENFSHYNFLSLARNTIRRMEASDAPEDAKTLYTAEVHALRGWMALYLYDLFGPVPVAPDDVLDNPTTFTYLPRLTDEEYDAMMEEDLNFAIEHLPRTADSGRMTQGAARMILLKYYMIRGFYEKAEALARDLAAMEGNPYQLFTNYNAIFEKANNGNNEVILDLPCSSAVEWHANHMTSEVLPADMPWTENSTGWGGYVMPWDFYNTFEEGDLRLEKIITSYVNKNGKEIDKTNSSQLWYGALPLKYGKDTEMADSHSGVNVVVYRFSDVLLTLAECIVRNNGAVTAEAVALVDRVRNRAGLPGLSAEATGSVDAFFDALLLERGHEFYLEGLRRQDLIRFGKYVEYANLRINDANKTNTDYTYFNVDESHNRFFIPQTFINESKSAIKQNPGY